MKHIYMMIVLCISPCIQGAAEDTGDTIAHDASVSSFIEKLLETLASMEKIQSDPRLKLAQESFSILQNDQKIKTQCNELLANLAKASQELSANFTGDILKVYSDPALATQDDLFRDRSIFSRALTLAKEIYSLDIIEGIYSRSLFEVYSEVKRKSLKKSPALRKKEWEDFKSLFRERTVCILSDIIHTDEQKYWFPNATDEHTPTRFLELNMHLTLSHEQIEALRAATLVHFLPYALQRSKDPYTDR